MLLIGIAGTRNQSTINAVRYLVGKVHLCHINMRQHIVDRLAIELGTTPHDIAHNQNPFRVIAPNQYTLRERERKIFNEVTANNQNFLIDLAETQIKKTEKRCPFIFGGAVISNISNNHEAEWLRKKGGHLIHLIDTRAIALTDRVERTSLEAVILTDNPHESINEKLCLVVNRFTNPLQKAS